CRARKTKCDNKRPVCGFCESTGGRCVYGDEERDHSRLDRGSLLILQRIGELEQSLTTLVGKAINQNSGHNTPDLSQSRAIEDETFSPDIIYASGEMGVESLLDWPVFQPGESGRQFPLVSILGQSSSESNRNSSMEQNYDIDPGAVWGLVSNFLSTNHIKNPILDIEMLWADARDFIETGLRWDGKSCLILLVCAVSVLSPPLSVEKTLDASRLRERRVQAEAYFQAAQRRIGMLYHENSMLAVQCSFLTAVYLMSTLRILAAWKCFAQAGTQCLGWLARRIPDPDAPEPEDPQRYVEESLYWSCLKSELELRTELGLPGSSLNEMRYPNVYPSPPRGAAQYPWGSASDVAEQTRNEQETGWFFYLAEIATRRMMNEALSSRYQPSSWYLTKDWWTEQEEHHLLHYVEQLDSKLDSWYRTLPAPIAFPSDPAEPVGDVLRGILRGHLIDIREVLYFPALKAAMFKSLDEIGPRTMQVATLALKNDMDRIMVCEEGYWHRHQGTWLMLRTCTRSCLHLLAAALRVRDEPRLRDMLPEAWSSATERVLNWIEHWKRESPDLELLFGILAGYRARLVT
ncbi:hypothetical protein GQ53DRAFT_855030, partial [Thozetella sp. PMI_491]